MKKIVLLVLAIAVLGLMGLTGCKNVCQKAASHMMGCIESYCSEHESNPMCSEENMAEMRQEAGGTECTDEMKAQAEAALQLSCEQITAGFALAEAFQQGMEGAGGAE
ncbi:MAG: hypothetical protein JW797_13425 [Bradymonadales bacterium]|nr:hypothetical protein [Bradymonadales bacterium]